MSGCGVFTSCASSPHSLCEYAVLPIGRFNNAATQNQIDNIEDLPSDQWRHVSSISFGHVSGPADSSRPRSLTLTCETINARPDPSARADRRSHSIFYLTKNFIPIMPWGASIVNK